MVPAKTKALIAYASSHNLSDLESCTSEVSSTKTISIPELNRVSLVSRSAKTPHSWNDSLRRDSSQTATSSASGILGIVSKAVGSAFDQGSRLLSTSSEPPAIQNRVSISAQGSRLSSKFQTTQTLDSIPLSRSCAKPQGPRRYYSKTEMLARVNNYPINTSGASNDVPLKIATGPFRAYKQAPTTTTTPKTLTSKNHLNSESEITSPSWDESTPKPKTREKFSIQTTPEILHSSEPQPQNSCLEQNNDTIHASEHKLENFYLPFTDTKSSFGSISFSAESFNTNSPPADPFSNDSDCFTTKSLWDQFYDLYDLGYNVRVVPGNPPTFETDGMDPTQNEMTLVHNQHESFPRFSILKEPRKSAFERYSPTAFASPINDKVITDPAEASRPNFIQSTQNDNTEIYLVRNVTKSCSSWLKTVLVSGNLSSSPLLYLSICLTLLHAIESILSSASIQSFIAAYSTDNASSSSTLDLPIDPFTASPNTPSPPTDPTYQNVLTKSSAALCGIALLLTILQCVSVRAKAGTLRREYILLWSACGIIAGLINWVLCVLVAVGNGGIDLKSRACDWAGTGMGEVCRIAWGCIGVGIICGAGWLVGAGVLLCVAV